MLISIIAACVFSSTNLAASTNVSLSPPKICTLKGYSRSSIYSISKVFLFLNLIPLSLIISQTTNPAPNSFTVTRKAALLIPAIGATTTRLGISTSPIFHIVFPPTFVSYCESLHREVQLILLHYSDIYCYRIDKLLLLHDLHQSSHLIHRSQQQSKRSQIFLWNSHI